MVLGYLFFFKFSLLTFLRSMPCLLSIKMCKEKIFRIKSMSTAILYVNLRFTVKNYCVCSKYTRNPVWWMEVDIDSQLSSISAVSTDLKKIRIPHNFFWDYRADKTFTMLVRQQSSSLSPSSILQVFWQSLQKATPENNWRIWLQNQWQSSFGCAQAQLGQIWLSSTNTGSFRVSCSCWGQLQRTAIRCIDQRFVFKNSGF